MWYFSWILGVCLAAAVGIINVLWYEQDNRLREDEDHNNEFNDKP